MIFQIKSILTEQVIFSGDYVSLRKCVEAAVARTPILDAEGFEIGKTEPTDLTGADLHEQNLDELDVQRAMFLNAFFRDSSLVSANFLECDLSRANLFRCILYGSNFSGTNLTAANFAETVCYGTYLGELVGVNFASTNLTDTDFSKADLRHCNFLGCTLARTRFYGANLEGVIGLEGAEL